jgi:hypothetical protein
MWQVIFVNEHGKDYCRFTSPFSSIENKYEAALWAYRQWVSTGNESVYGFRLEYF